MPSADRTAVTDADFYLLEQSLEPDDRELLHRVRELKADRRRAGGSV